MDADDFRDDMLAFLFLRYLSDNDETAAKKELGQDFPAHIDSSVPTPLQLWYGSNLHDVPDFEKQMRRKVVGEAEIDLAQTHQTLLEIEQEIAAAKAKHNAYVKELGLKPLP